MTYIVRIDEVAKKFAITKPFLNRAMDLWENLEASAEMLGYDILSDHMRSVFNSEEAALGRNLRDHVRALIVVLYEQDGANWEDDCSQLREKDKIYGGSWCKRGGQGAFMMLARKADRVAEAMLDKTITDVEDTLGDWRRYLILVEAWHVDAEKARLTEAIPTPSPPEYCVDSKLVGHCDKCGELVPSGQQMQTCNGMPF